MPAPRHADARDLAAIPPLVGEYRRRRPEQTLLYRVVQENIRTFVQLREDQERPLPPFVRREFEKFLVCGQLSEGFARVHCGRCGYDRLVAFSCKGRFCPSCVGRRMNDGAAFIGDHVVGDTPVRHWVLSLPRPLRYLLAHDSALLGEVVGVFIDTVFRFLRWKAKEAYGLRSVSQAHPGAVTVIQRCSGDLSLNVHFHSLVTDGVFLEEYSGGPVSFHELPTPTDGDVADVAAEVCRRTRDVLVRRGRWTDDPDEPPDDDGAPEGLADLYAASVRGILLLGPRRGQRIVRFFGECARRPRQGPESGLSGNAFNLHAGHTVPADDREGVERLARYILRPPIGQARLTRRADGLVALSLSRPWRDGTAGVLLPPLDFLARLVAAIPRPRTNTIRFHGVYAPHARLRRAVVPPRHEGRDGQDGCACGPGDPIRRTLRLSWAQLLQRVFRVDVFFCTRCASPGMQRIAWITDNETIVKILRAVGLPTDSPAAHPARRPDEAFE